MITFQRQHCILDITFILLLSSIMFMSSCKQTDNAKEMKKLVSNASSIQAPLNLLQRSQVDTFVDNYKNYTGPIDPSFMYTDLQSQFPEKIASFWMDTPERSHFFQTLGQLEAAVANQTLDSVSLQVVMAFLYPSSLGGNIQKTNFVPILQFLVNQDSVIDMAYALTAFEPQVNWASYECKDDSRKKDPEVEISCAVATSLVNHWIRIPTDSINEQLYLYDSLSPHSNQNNIADRVEYYTFNNNDTKGIHDHYASLNANNDSCYFHLHLGLLNRNDEIPMRNVIHLDEVNLKADSVFSITKSTFFEFSNPCPKFCGDNTTSGNK